MSDKIRCTRKGDEFQVSFLTAKLDIFCAADITETFAGEFEKSGSGARRVAFLLHNVEQIDSTVLGFLVRTHIRLGRNGVRTILRNPSPGIAGVLRTSGLDRDFTIENA
ncbi:MAG: anti-sigma factor antagonist [Spirochaetes bacterium]|nr:MAG: anti-sigma factor antagonist [Spirochaetota bacterium]